MSSQPPKFSGVFDQIIQGIQTGIQIAGAATAGGGKPKGVCGQTQLTGDGDIALCLDQLFTQLQSATAGMSLPEKIAAYGAFLAFMKNPQYFKQGASPHYLGNQITNEFPRYITDLKTQLAALQAAGGVLPPTLPPTGNPTQGTQTAIDNNFINGVPNIYLLGAAALFGAALLWRK